MPHPDTNQQISLSSDLVNLATYRKEERIAGNTPDPIVILVAYAQDEMVYDNGRITSSDPGMYAANKSSPHPDLRNLLVNKFGLAYVRHMPLLLHRRLADVLIDTAVDMLTRHRQFTVVMDGLRTYEAAERMQQNRPDLVTSGMLAPAGASAHNRALAVDTKLFELIDPLSFETWTGSIPLSALVEADEHGHLDDEQPMHINSRFYNGPMTIAARKNRDQRLIAWQRASVKNKTPIASLLAEFWDDRVPGNPADMWRILACRALCIGIDAKPATSPLVKNLKTQLDELHKKHQQESSPRQNFAEKAHGLLTHSWNTIFSLPTQQKLEALLGPGGGTPPPLDHFIFHEWLNNIHDHHIASHLQI